MFKTITTDPSNPISTLPDKLMPKNTLIQYKKNDGEIDVIDGADNPSTAATIEDLDTLLRERDWNIYTRKIIKEGTLNISFEKFDSDIPDITTDTKLTQLTNINSIKRETTQINTLISKLLTEGAQDDLSGEFNMKEKMIDFMNIQERYISASSSIRAPFMERLADNYTSTLNINNFLQEDENHNILTPTVKLGIAYTKEGIRGSHNIIINPYKVTNGELTYVNQVIELLNVTAEINKGIIRLFPNSPNISECIILDCTLIYEFNQL